MAKVAATTLQTLWDCRWGRPAYRLQGAADRDQSEGPWVCIRAGRRTVTEEECERCEFWEATDIISERDERE